MKKNTEYDGISSRGGAERYLEKERIQWIDLARTIAIMCVVLCHSVESVYQWDVDYVTALNMKSEIFVFFSFTLGRLGVPVFMLISGYLLLNDVYDENQCLQFWKRKWGHLLFCTEIWILIYHLVLSWYNQQNLSINLIVRDLLFFHKVNMSHIWYMLMILGMYILIPFVSNALHTLDLKTVKIPIVFFIICAFVYPFLTTVCTILGVELGYLQLSLGFSGGAYGLYFILGYMIRKGTLLKVQNSILIVLAGMSFAATVYLQMLSYNHGVEYKVWYDCVFVLLCSCSLFELLSRFHNVIFYKAVKYIAEYSFGIYLVHNIFRLVLFPKILEFGFPNPVTVIGLWFTLMVASLICVRVISLIPKVGKYILYLK